MQPAGHEKLLELFQERGREFLQTCDVFGVVRMNADCEKPVIRFGFTTLRLLRLDHPDNPNLEQTSHMCRLIRQHKHIQWVAVFPRRRWDQTENR